MKKMNWLKWPLEHYSISLLIIGILFVLGIYGMYVMPKDEFPAFTIRQGVVAFGHYGKALFEVFKYLGAEKIGYNQPASAKYATENPF
ncbi:MAG: hypothetical protein J6Q17_03220, partial [Clostridia bacterium]|nr:hypothetical protein [Clostridia bacterium]